jgi:hypothetical protein
MVRKVSDRNVAGQLRFIGPLCTKCLPRRIKQWASLDKERNHLRTIDHSDSEGHRRNLTECKD